MALRIFRITLLVKNFTIPFDRYASNYAVVNKQHPAILIYPTRLATSDFVRRTK